MKVTLIQATPNPIETIADGTLEEWCEALRQALTVSIENS